MSVNHKTWSNLQVEMHLKILEYLDFSSRNRFRQCSKYSRELIESLKNEIIFLKIESIDNSIEFKIYSQKSPSLSINSLTLKTSETTVISAVFANIFTKNSKIHTLFLRSLKHSSNVFWTEILGRNSKALEKVIIQKLILGGWRENPQKSGTIKNLLKNFQKCSIVIRNWTLNPSRNWNDWKDYNGAFKSFEVSRWKTKIGKNSDFISIEHLTSAVELNVVSFVARIEANPQSKCYWVPGFHAENPERQMNIFRGEFVRHPNFCTMTIQVDARNSIFVKFSDCGVFLICGDLKNFNLEEHKCGLEFLCPGNLKCHEESVENAVFREITCNLTGSE